MNNNDKKKILRINRDEDKSNVDDIEEPISPQSRWIAENIDTSLRRGRERDVQDYQKPILKSRAVTEPMVKLPLSKSLRSHTDRLHNISDLHRIGTYYNDSDDPSVDSRRRISTDFDIKTVLQKEKVPSRQSRLASSKTSIFSGIGGSVSNNNMGVFKQKASLVYSSPSMSLHAPPTKEMLEKLYLLHIHVIEGTNLKAADANGKSDPFLRLNFGNIKYRTRTIPRDLNPTFNQFFTFPVLDLIDDDKLSIVCWDRDALSANDFLGLVEIKITELLGIPSMREQAWYPLYTKNYQKKSQGQLHLKMALVEWKEGEDELLKLVSESPRLIASQQQEALSFMVENNQNVELSLACATWNLDYCEPPENLIPWLQLSNPDGSDILAVSVQKCRYTPRYPFKTAAADWLGTLSNNCGPHYHLIAYESVHYTRLAIFAHSRCVDAITNVEKATKKFSIINDYGTVAISFIIGHLKWCFLNTLVDPNSESIPYRNNQINDTIKNLNFGNEKLDIMSQFHHVFWMGDFGCLKIVNKGDGFEADSLYNAQMVGDIFPNFNDTIQSKLSTNIPVHGQFSSRILTHFMNGYQHLVTTRCNALANQVVNEGDYLPAISVFDIGLIDLPSAYDPRVGECTARILQLKIKSTSRMKNIDSLYIVVSGSSLSDQIVSDLLIVDKNKMSSNKNSDNNSNKVNSNELGSNSNNELREEYELFSLEDSQIPELRIKDGFNSKSRLKYEWFLFTLQTSRSSNNKIRLMSDPIIGRSRISLHQISSAAILHDDIFSRWCCHFKFEAAIYHEGLIVGKFVGVVQLFWRELPPPKIIEPIVNYTSSVITGHVTESSEDDKSDVRPTSLSNISTIMQAIGLFNIKRKRRPKRVEPSRGGNLTRIKGLREALSRRIKRRKEIISANSRKVSNISDINENEKNNSIDTSSSLSYSKYDSKSIASHPMTTTTTTTINMLQDDYISYNFKQNLVMNIGDILMELVNQRQDLGDPESLDLFLTRSSWDRVLKENWNKKLESLENINDLVNLKDLMTLLLSSLDQQIKKRNGWIRSRVAQSVDLTESRDSNWAKLSSFVVAHLNEDESVLENWDSDSDDDYEHETNEDDFSIRPPSSKVPFPYNNMDEYLDAKNRPREK